MRLSAILKRAPALDRLLTGAVDHSHRNALVPTPAAAQRAIVPFLSHSTEPTYDEGRWPSPAALSFIACVLVPIMVVAV